MNYRFVWFITMLLLAISSQAQTLKDQWVLCNDQGCKLLDPYYREGVTMKWDGPCVNGKANGYGKVIKYSNGEYESTYEGDYKDGIREGKGKFSHYSGTVLECTFKNGQAVGYGKYQLTDGNFYEGGIVNYRSHGYGKTILASGAHFEGFYVSDAMYTGKYTNYDGKVTYVQGGLPVDKIRETKSGYKPQIGVRVTEYFDEDWKRCSQKEASYYRLVTYASDNIPIGNVRDFYMDGQLQSEFTAVYLDYDDEGKNFHEGEATHYHRNGKVSARFYYYNNKLNGTYTNYYENGKPSEELNYSYGILDGPRLLWYQTGRPKFIAEYEDGELVDNKYIEFDENGVGSLVYQENFGANEERWESQIGSSISKVTSENTVSLNVPKNEPASRLTYVTLDQTSDYSIESTVHKSSGKGKEGYGIIFGFKDWDNFFEFLISEMGVYLIRSRFEGVNLVIADWTRSSAIKTGNKPNELKIFKLDDEFKFFINGTLVKSTTSKDLRGNNFGVLAGGSGDYVLQNLIIKEFLSSEELAKRAPKVVRKNEDEWSGNGSGFFISEKGYIATNFHVVEDAKYIQVEYIQKGVKQTFKAEVVVTDKQNDLAIIQIKDAKFKTLPTIPYVFSTTTRDLGTDVFALGYPMADVMGAEIKFTDGKISSKTGIKGDIRVYQISVPIQPGNSGGPLFDSKGNLVGITSSRLSKEYYDTENVNYAIKTSFLKALVDVLPENITLPNSTTIAGKPLTEKIKLLSDFTPLIRVK